MPLLDDTAQAERDFAQEAVDRIFANLGNMHRQCVNTTTTIFGDIWSAPNATPDQVLARLGQKARDLFVLSGQFQDLLNTARPNSIALSPPLPITIHDDGTVTIDPPAEPTL